MPNSNGQPEATVRIIERIVVAAPPPRTPPPLLITFRPRVRPAGVVPSRTPEAYGGNGGSAA